MSEISPSGSQEHNSVRLESHMLFICPECGKELSTQLEWRYHLNIVHDYLLKTSKDFNYKVIDGKYYECQVCLKWLSNAFSVPALLQYHRFIHLSYPEIYRCRLCTVSFKRKRVLCDHLVRFHSVDQNLNSYENVLHIQALSNSGNTSHVEFSEIDENDLEHVFAEMFEEIDDQDEPTPSSSSLATLAGDKLQQEMQKYIQYLCPVCGLGFNNHALWRSHVFGMHNLANAVNVNFQALNSLKTAFLCMVCQKIQRTSKHFDLRRHYFQHMPHQFYLKCTICKITKPSKQKMFHHLQFLHTGYIKGNAVPITTRPKTGATVKKFQCLQCDKTYMSDSRFKYHCRTCPKRLAPIPTGNCDVTTNMTLMKHLQMASLCLDAKVEEAGIDPSTLKLAYK